jgi:hypothetical protein
MRIMTTLIEKKAQEYMNACYPDDDYVRENDFITGWKACRGALYKSYIAALEGQGKVRICDIDTFGDEQIAGDSESNHLGDMTRYQPPATITEPHEELVADIARLGQLLPAFDVVYKKYFSTHDDPHNYDWVDATGVGP